MPRAVDRRGIDQRLRKRLEVLAQQKYAIWYRKVGYDQAVPRIEPAERSDHQVDRQHGELVGDHHGAENHREKYLASAKLPARETISRQCGDRDLTTDSQ